MPFADTAQPMHKSVTGAHSVAVGRYMTDDCNPLCVIDERTHPLNLNSIYLFRNHAAKLLQKNGLYKIFSRKSSLSLLKRGFTC